MSLTSADGMALDKGGDLLDEIMSAAPDRRHVLACIKSNYPLDQFDGKGRNAFSWAAAKGYVPELQAMIGRGIWRENVDEQGKTPLILAADGGHLDAVRVLAESKVQLDARDKENRTAAQRALSSGFNEVTAYLISMGASPPPVDLDTELKQPTAVFSRPLSLTKKPEA